MQERFEKVRDIVLGEVNVKEVEFITDTAGLITKKIKPNFKTLGKRYGKQMKEIAAFMAGLSQQDIAAIESAGLLGGTYTLALASGDAVLEPGDYEVTSEDMPGWLVASEGTLTIALDITITDGLRREGTARELINRIQNLRKDSGFEVTDKINVIIDGGKYAAEISDSLADFSDYICAQTLALSISAVSGLDGAVETEWGEGFIKIKVTKVKNI